MNIGELFFGKNSQNPIAQQGITGVGSFVSSLLSNIFVIAGVVLLALLMWGGFEIMRGAGSSDQEQAARGRKIITAAIAGFLIIVASYFIIQVVERVTRLDIL